MNLDFLHQTLANTLVASREQFKQAEYDLVLLEKQPGFAPALLEIIFQENVDLGVRRAAAVYFKNKVTRFWPPMGVDPLSAEDKKYVKERIVPSIEKAPNSLREFFVVCLSTMLTYEFGTGNWPELLPQVTQLLQNTSDLQGVVAGLVILKQICKYYRWQNRSNNKQLTPLMAEVYPYILQISEAAINALHSGEEQDLYYHLIYEVLKIYKLATTRFLPEIIREEEIAKRTITLFVNVLIMQPNNKDLVYPDKCAKWATGNIVRCYNTFLTKSYMQLSENGAQYTPYRNLFVSLFCPEISRLYIEQLQLWCTNQRHFANAVLSNVIVFLTAMIDVRHIYCNFLEPQLEGLVSQVIFRLLSPTEEDLDLFEDDPTEFIHRNMSNSEKIYDQSSDASMFILRLVKKRKNTLPMLLRFLDQTAGGIAPQIDAIGPKVGILNLLQSLAPALLGKGSLVGTNLEPFVRKYILPDFNSNHEYVKTAVCETITKLAGLEYKERDTLLILFNGLLNCFENSKCLPLQVSSALALQALSMEKHNNDIRAALGDHISDIVSILLVLTEKVDSESLLGVLDHFVDLYPEQITPFAIDLASHLCTQFSTLASEIAEQQNDQGKGAHISDAELMLQNDEKINSGLGIMNSLCNLQGSLQHRPDLTTQLDAVIAPIFSQVYLLNLSDFYTDCFTLHESTLFSMKSIPEKQWEFFDLLTKMLESAEIDYFEDVMPVLENYVLYGSQSLAADPTRLAAFTQLLISLYAPQPHELANIVSTGEHMVSAAYSEARTRGHVMSLLVKLLTSNEMVKGPMIPYIPQIVESVSNRVTTDAQSGISVPPRYNVALVSVILGCVFNEPNVTLAVLDQFHSTSSFFEMWFQTMPEFVRVTDFKLAEMAILSLIVTNTSNQTVNAHLERLLHILCECLKNMPEAVRRIMELVKEEEWDEDEDDDLDDGYNYDDEDEEEEILPVSDENREITGNAHGDGNFIYERPGNTTSSETQTHTQIQDTSEDNDSTQDFSASLDLGLLAEDFDEQLYAMNPLDKLNPYNALRMVWNSIPVESKQQLLTSMSADDKNILESSLSIDALVDPKNGQLSA